MKKRGFSWLNPKLVIKDTQKYGKGVFADKYIKIVKSISTVRVNSFIVKYIASKEPLLAGVGDFNFLKNVI